MPKRNAKQTPTPSDEELGIWVDTALLNKHLGQRSLNMFNQPMGASADRLLHFADLALGSIKPDKFKAEEVSKKREKK